MGSDSPSLPVLEATGPLNLADLKKLGRHYLGYSDAQIAMALQQTELREVMCDDQEEG
jgi:hypothetical protein